MDYTEALVYITSEDGYDLEGVVIRPASETPGAMPVVWIHGLTGRFYSRHLVAIGRALAAKGHVFVIGNNRGHDFGAILNRAATGERLIAGGAWERFDESPYDVAAWVSFTHDLGFPKVALLGHSLGALKVAYYQALRQDPRVAGLIAASPPARAGQVNPELRDLAERMEREGRGRDLLPWNSFAVGGTTISADAYLNRVRTNIDVYGFAHPEPLVAQIRCPILAFYGTNEPTVGGADDLEAIRRNARAAERVESLLIEGADHVYTGRAAEVADVIAAWVATLGM